MNFGEMYIAAFYERVKHFATVANLRFRGAAGRNWTDLDILAFPLPPTEADGKRRAAEVVQCKWRAKFSLGDGGEEWLDTSVVNVPAVHEEARRFLNDWPYWMVLITTNVWLSTVADRAALRRQLDETARKASPTCVGAKLITFEEIAEEWRHALGDAVRGWAEDPFSFHLQILQLGQTQPPGRHNLPPSPVLTSLELGDIVAYQHENEASKQTAAKWVKLLLTPLNRKVKNLSEYDEEGWLGVTASVWGGASVFLGRIPDSPNPVFSTWCSEEEVLRMPVVSGDDLTKAAQRFYAWWCSWGEGV